MLLPGSSITARRKCTTASTAKRIGMHSVYLLLCHLLLLHIFSLFSCSLTFVVQYTCCRQATRPQCLCFTCRSRQEWSNYTWLDRIGVLFPIVNWVRKYNIKQNLLVSIAIVGCQCWLCHFIHRLCAQYHNVSAVTQVTPYSR